MKTILGVLGCAVALTCIERQPWAQATVSWTGRYDGPGSGSDVATNLATDAAGNVYVTGSSGGPNGLDYVTIKYDPTGNELWVSRYDGTNNGFDQPYAIAVDGAGNVYISGTSQGAGTAADLTTVKYDTNGNELWVQRYDGPVSGDDAAFDLVLDAAGNVYAAGWSDGTGAGIFGWDFVTVAYDTNGGTLWERRYDGPSGGGDRANALALDAAGNVYVAGRSRGVGTFDDYTTIKYDPSGTELWVARYSGPGNGIDNALDIAVDAAGNSHVTGYSDGSGIGPDGWDCATVKYDTNGSELWARRYNGPGDKWDEGWQLALDGAGNVHVGGGSISGGNNWDFSAIKYDAAGNELWVRRYDGPASGFDEAFALALDGAGNVYLTGGSENASGDDDFATVKYSSDGTELWVARYEGVGAGLDDAYVVVIDPAGNVVIAGESESGGVAPEADFGVALYPPHGLYGDRDQISLAAGGQQALSLGAGQDQAGRFYLVLGSLLGTSPGFPIDSVELPLVVDTYFVFSLTHPNSALLSNTFGVLDAAGRAEAAFGLPAGAPADLAGTTAHHAYVTIDAAPAPGQPFVPYASNAVPLLLLP